MKSEPMPSRTGRNATAVRASGRPAQPATASVTAVPSRLAPSGSSRIRRRVQLVSRNQAPTATTASPPSSGTSCRTCSPRAATTLGMPVTVVLLASRSLSRTAASTASTRSSVPLCGSEASGRTSRATASGLGTRKSHCGRGSPSSLKITRSTKAWLCRVGRPPGMPFASRAAYRSSKARVARTPAAATSSGDPPRLRACASAFARSPSR